MIQNLAPPPPPPPKADFHTFIDLVRQYLGIDDPAKTGLQIRIRTSRYPNMFHMEQSSRPLSLKLPLMDDIAKLLQNQDTVVRPGPSSSTSLDIGQFIPNPPNRGNRYLKNAVNSLDAYRLKNLQAAPISGPDLFECSLMQEYEQHLIDLGVKTGNQQSARFHPYGKNKKKPRGRGRGAYQQGGYYPLPPPEYIMPPQFYLQQQRWISRWPQGQGSP